MRFIALAIMVLLVLPAVAFSAEVSVEHAMSAYATGNLNKAVAELEEYVRLHPQDKKGFYYLGYTYYKKGNMDKAREAFGSAYLLDPDYAPALPEKVAIPSAEPEKPTATQQEKTAEPKQAVKH